jgi:regulator of protease activity HflC (stomatin/prohibitin superfamily)
MEEHKINLGFLVPAAIAGVIVIFLILSFGWINVHPTEVAVQTNKLAGKVEKEPLGVGYHFFNRWVTDMAIYKVAARAFPEQSMATEGKREYNLNVKTNDGQNVSVDMTIIYSLGAKEVPSLHQSIGQNYSDQVLLPQIRSEARIAIGGYSAEEIYQGKVRDEIQNQIKERLVHTLAKYPAIQIQDALMRDFKFSSQFEAAIEQKKLAAQQVEINRNRAMAQDQEAARIEAEAKGQKLKAIQEAEGRAQSAKIEADAEKYRLEQEAAGNLAKYKAEAEGKRLSAEALGGGANVVALEFARNIPDKLQIWGIPTGNNSTSIMDLNGVFGNMLKKQE